VGIAAREDRASLSPGPWRPHTRGRGDPLCLSRIAKRRLGDRGRSDFVDGTELMDVRRNAWIWMGAAFSASLGLAVSIVAVLGIERGVYVALAATARLAFVIFWPAYAGGALASLFGSVFLPLRDHARDLGLAFAAALSVHLWLVACLCVIGHAPDLHTFVIFGVAAGFTYLLALLSIRQVRHVLPQKLWLLVRAVAMNYILFAFLLDFAKFPSNNLRDVVKYLPFVALGFVGPILKLAVWATRWPGAGILAARGAHRGKAGRA
jgi:hypothetical protein